jgi:hypothetical protein
MPPNDIDLYSNDGGLAPYTPSQPLAPAPDWGQTTDVDLTRDYTRHTGGGQSVFGQTLPAGVSIADMQNAFGQLATVFQSDFTALKHKPSHIQAAVSWMINALTNPPQQQRQHHSYNLYEHKSDPIFQAFANYAHDHGFSNKFVQDACWWITETTKKLNTQQVQASGPAPRTAPNSDPTDALSDAQYAAVVKANDAAKAQTYGYLQNLWGDSFQSNLRMVDAYFTSLPIHEQRTLDVYTTGWIRALNTKEIILGLYQQAIGIHSMPTSGGAVATEIAQCEHVMKVDRKRWLADERLQARYRELLRIRSGG